MSLTSLPEDILIMIIQWLDTQSIQRMYYSCNYFRNLFHMHNLVRECHMSMNTLATVNTFKTDFFKYIAANLVELNLCGVPDLRKTLLIPAMKKMKKLKILDISFTNLTLIDFTEIYTVCPTIINVSLNFMIKKSGLLKIPNEIVIQCQEIFKKFKCINLVGSATNLLYSKLALLILKEAELDTLKYTIAECDRLHTMYVPDDAGHVGMIKFKQFCLAFLDCHTAYDFGSFFRIPVLSMIDLSTIEAVVIMKEKFKEYCIHATPVFQNYFQQNFEVDSDKVYHDPITEYRVGIGGNAAIMIWNKDAHTFDDSFFTKLTKLLKPYFPCDCQLYKGSSVPSKYDWFFLTPEPADKADNNCERPPTPLEMRRKRIAPPMNVLNFDDLFRTKETVQLTLLFDEYIRNPVALPVHCDYLRKLTFVSMRGSVRFSADFFNVLFMSCVNLVTVNIESPPISPCAAPVSRAIHMSPKLKNLRIIDKRIDFKTLLVALAKCKSLENVHLLDECSGENVDIDDPSLLIDACPNLYNLYIKARMTETVRIRKTQILHNAKMSSKKHYLNLVLNVKTESKMFYSYEPFLSVFKLDPIRQLI